MDSNRRSQNWFVAPILVVVAIVPITVIVNSLSPHATIALPTIITSEGDQVSFADKTCGDMLSGWKRYSDPNHDFTVEYPGFSRPEVPHQNYPGLLSATRFDFSQPIQTDVNVANVNFSVQISVWQNPEHLSTEAWARKRNANPRTILSQRPIDGRNGIMLHQTWEGVGLITVFVFVAESDRMYEISYFDTSNFDNQISNERKLCWTAVINKMLESFKIFPH